jgi:micrococcal nuclease
VARKSLRIRYAISGRLKLAITVAALLAAIIIGLLDQGWARRHEQNPPPVSQATEFSDQQRYHQKEFSVTKVVDGDTLDIDALDGDRLTTRIRLIGVDTPETKKPNTPVMYYGPEASEFAKSLADGKRVTVWLDTISKTRDRYGRLLAFIRLPDGRVLNEVLISEGYGYADLRFKHGFFEKYSQLEGSARRAKKGLWAGVTEDQLPQWLQERRPDLVKGR